MVKTPNKASTSRHSVRLGLEYRVLDEETKRQRVKKHLDALEKDNVQDDPHANVVINKAIPKFADELVYSSGDGIDSTNGKTRKRKATSDFSPIVDSTKKGRKLRAELAKTRFRKSFTQLTCEEEQRLRTEEPGISTYYQIRAPPSKIPPKKFCSVCGLFSKYNCVRCGLKYCSIRCRDIHVDTRCLRWTS